MRCSQECTYCEFPIPSSEFLPIKILNSCLFIYNHINLIGWKVRNYSEFHIENLWKYEVSNSYVYKSKLYIFVWHLKFLVQYIILLLYKYLVKWVHNVSHMNIKNFLVFFIWVVEGIQSWWGQWKMVTFQLWHLFSVVLNLSLASIKAHPKILVPFHRAGIEIFSLVLSIPTPQILSFGAASTM